MTRRAHSRLKHGVALLCGLGGSRFGRLLRPHLLQRAQDRLIDLLDAFFALAAKSLLEPAEILDAFPDVFSFAHASDCSSA